MLSRPTVAKVRGIDQMRFRGKLPSLLLGALLSVAGSAWSAGLPDFTKLVEANAPAVVNISTVQRPDSRSSQLPRSRNGELDEFFRRFFGPDGRSSPYVRPRSLGSGFVISKDGYLLTNNHVVDGADEILVRFSDRRELNAVVVGADPRSDLAGLRVDRESVLASQPADDLLRIDRVAERVGLPAVER